VNCGSAWAQSFTLDAFGNIAKSGSISWNPGYNASTNRYTMSGTSYDANGNLLSDSFNTYTWDPNWGSLASANGAAIIYDALGRMVENHNGQFEFTYSPFGGQSLAAMQGQTLAESYVPLPGGVVAVYQSPGLFQYNHPDWLGSARLFSTPSRGAVAAMAFAPFGEGYAGGQHWLQFTSTGYAWTVFDTENQTGSLEDFTYRRYSPVQGRWISPDPAGVAAVDPTNPQSWNRYTYVLNNPLSFTDPLDLTQNLVPCPPDPNSPGASTGFCITDPATSGPSCPVVPPNPGCTYNCDGQGRYLGQTCSNNSGNNPAWYFGNGNGYNGSNTDPGSNGSGGSGGNGGGPNGGNGGNNPAPKPKPNSPGSTICTPVFCPANEPTRPDSPPLTKDEKCKLATIFGVPLAFASLPIFGLSAATSATLAYVGLGASFVGVACM
jgi:RHS repeat-associated protein